MKYTTTKPSATQAAIEVILDEADLMPLKAQALAKLAKHVKVPGFRPGKTPVDVAEKHLDTATLQQEVLETAVNKFYIDALLSDKLQPLDQPQVSVGKFVPFTTLEFTATVDVLPEIKLPDYTKLKKSAPKVTVKAAEITEVIDRLRGQLAEKKEVERAAKDGDELSIDFAGKDADGEAVAGATGTDYPLRLGSKTFIDGFEDNLVGMKKGDQKEFTLTFPKDYGHKPLANKKVTFAVTVKKAQEVVMPATDDDFAKKVGPFDKVEDLKKDIKEELTRQKETEARNALKNEVMEELVKKSAFPLPAVLVKDQERLVRQDATQNLSYRGITLPEYLKTEKMTEEEWVAKEVTPAAEKRVATGLILSEIAKKENISATPEEVSAKIAELKPHYQDEKMKSQLDSPEAARDIASRLVTEKTIERLLEVATA